MTLTGLPRRLMIRNGPCVASTKSQYGYIQSHLDVTQITAATVVTPYKPPSRSGEWLLVEGELRQ
jgi:hypothetical protein